jgi:plasmid stabilization system protein ParE
MKGYRVIFEGSAQENVRESYGWGSRVWGKREARQWARELRNAVVKESGVVPKGFPLAAENELFSEEIRQMIIGRYRVLFTIKGRNVHVLHVRGAFVGTTAAKYKE